MFYLRIRLRMRTEEEEGEEEEERFVVKTDKAVCLQGKAYQSEIKGV